MPKVIKDIEKKTFNAAIELFGKYGYSNVEMKMIAKEAGIAVGTLYNYYPNKKQLFIKVFEYSWEETFSKIDNIITSSLTPYEKIDTLVETLYEDMENRRGIGRELTEEKVFNKDDNKLIWIKNRIIEKINNLAEEIDKENEKNIDKGMLIRLLEMLMVSISTMLHEHRDEKEKNLKFLNGIVHFIIENKVFG